MASATISETLNLAGRLADEGLVPTGNASCHRRVLRRRFSHGPAALRYRIGTPPTTSSSRGESHRKPMPRGGLGPDPVTDLVYSLVPNGRRSTIPATPHYTKPVSTYPVGVLQARLRAGLFATGQGPRLLSPPGWDPGATQP